jgi:hypothetical protein
MTDGFDMEGAQNINISDAARQTIQREMPACVWILLGFIDSSPHQWLIISPLWGLSAECDACAECREQRLKG